MLGALKSMDFMKLEAQGYVPVYTRTEITDRLHEAFGFRTDYEIVTNKMMKNILKVTQK